MAKRSSSERVVTHRGWRLWVRHVDAAPVADMIVAAVDDRELAYQTFQKYALWTSIAAVNLIDPQGHRASWRVTGPPF